MLRRYSKSRSAASGSYQGDISHSVKSPASLDVHEKRISELSKALEESQRNTDQVFY